MKHNQQTTVNIFIYILSTHPTHIIQKNTHTHKKATNSHKQYIYIYFHTKRHINIEHGTNGFVILHILQPKQEKKKKTLTKNTYPSFHRSVLLQENYK